MSFVKLKSYICHGLEPREVTIEVLKTRGLSQLLMTGSLDVGLKASRDKIKSLVARQGHWGPLDRIHVNLLPVEELKVGAHLELSIVLGCLAALHQGQLPHSSLKMLEHFKFVGSVGLDGSLLNTPLSEILERAAPDCTLGPKSFAGLADLWAFVLSDGSRPLKSKLRSADSKASWERSVALEGPIENRNWEKFWLQVAAIAELHVLLVGPPGSGKSTLARWAHRLLPRPDEKTSFEREQIWNMAGMETPFEIPFVAPHSRTLLSEFLGLCRKGFSKPGIYAMAHGGLLVLDEFLDMNRDCREILRVILDSKQVLKSTGGQSVLWPAHFWLIATSNPCPCGLTEGEDRSECLCTTGQIQAYQSRLSGPIAERFGLKLGVPRTPYESSFDFEKEIALDETSARERIAELRLRAQELLGMAKSLCESNLAFRRLSYREYLNKVRLMAAVKVLTNWGWDEVNSILKIQCEKELRLMRSTPRLDLTGISR